METEDFAELVRVDLTAAYGLIRLVASAAGGAPGRDGAVINVSSVVGGTSATPTTSPTKRPRPAWKG